ncbi:MAG: zinc ribbon domain-containing protein [bacterium]|nr:zinc ribbon domain-containing protein [bacterium]
MAAEYCQSCGMPMNTEEAQYGTEVDGSLSDEYCIYCYKDGQFTQPDITLAQMADLDVSFMTQGENAMSAEEARKIVDSFLPTLKRWQK